MMRQCQFKLFFLSWLRNNNSNLLIFLFYFAVECELIYGVTTKTKPPLCDCRALWNRWRWRWFLMWTSTNWVTGACSPFTHTLCIYKTLSDILCSGLSDLFTSWFIFIVVICYWPNGLVSEAHIINHEGHYCSIITLSLSEATTFPVCALDLCP